MKKLLMFALVLFSFVNITYADEYVTGKKVYCGTDEVIITEKIEKSNAILVNNLETSEYFIWSEDNTCREVTDQDTLDGYNSPNVYIEDSGNTRTITKSNFTYYEYAVLSTDIFDENETYYSWNNDDEVFEEETDITELNYTTYTYYIKKYFKHADKAEIENDLTYYEFDKLLGNENESSVYKVALRANLDVANITDYLVETTIEDINITTTTYTYNETVYNNLANDYYQVSLELVNNKLYAIAYQLDYQTYEFSNKIFDEDGNEITEYENCYLVSSDNYYLIYSKINNTVKVYDIKTNTCIATITLENDYGLFSLISPVEYNNGVYFIEYNFSGNPIYITDYVKTYKVLDGDNQTYDNKDLTVRFNGTYSLFSKVLVNNTELDSSNYTSKEGSTIITLNNSYLSTLNDGTYTLTATYTDGASISTNFTVNRNPNTVDNITTYIITFTISLSIIVAYLYITKKEA